MNIKYQLAQKILFLEDGKTAEELEAETLEHLKIHRERDKWYRYAGAIFGGSKGLFHSVFGSRLASGALGTVVGFGVAYIITKIAHYLQRQSYDACKRKYGSVGDDYNDCKRDAIDIVVGRLKADRSRCDTELCKRSIDREVIRLEREKGMYPV